MAVAEIAAGEMTAPPEATGIVQCPALTRGLFVACASAEPSAVDHQDTAEGHPMHRI
jgi:hypothetical protein